MPFSFKCFKAILLSVPYICPNFVNLPPCPQVYIHGQSSRIAISPLSTKLKIVQRKVYLFLVKFRLIGTVNFFSIYPLLLAKVGLRRKCVCERHFAYVSFFYYNLFICYEFAQIFINGFYIKKKKNVNQFRLL